MASFNLGNIRGTKGDTGPKGDKGDKGDTGARGLKGEDGITPIFSVGKVVTLSPGSDAAVTIDNSDASFPKLSFSIPSGFDGADSVGDMQKSVYDTEGLNTDFYAYARDLYGKCVKIEGAVMLGKLVASEGNITERCVRNIIFSDSLPTAAANGDLCFIVKDDAGKKLSECEIGTIVLLDEGDAKGQYIVAAKNYYTSGSVSLIRRNTTRKNYYFDAANREDYCCSEIDFYLETIFAESYAEHVKKNLISTNIDTDLTRRCFLPSKGELQNMTYFVNNGIKASADSQTIGSTYMTRETDGTKTLITVNTEGEFSSTSQEERVRIRPMIVLDGNLYVENTLYKDELVAVPIDRQKKLYLRTEGDWKELIV